MSVRRPAKRMCMLLIKSTYSKVCTEGFMAGTEGEACMKGSDRFSQLVEHT